MLRHSVITTYGSRIFGASACVSKGMHYRTQILTSRLPRTEKQGAGGRPVSTNLVSSLIRRTAVELNRYSWEGITVVQTGGARIDVTVDHPNLRRGRVAEHLRNVARKVDELGVRFIGGSVKPKVIVRLNGDP